LHHRHRALDLFSLQARRDAMNVRQELPALRAEVAYERVNKVYQ